MRTTHLRCIRLKRTHLKPARPTQLQDNRNPEPVRRGRPRRLQLDQVLEAALAIGLNKLTMAAVAERLGVGKAVLYGYVQNRDELIRHASVYASRRHRNPSDIGQPWTEWVIEYARALFEVLTMEGDLLETWLAGGQSPVLEVDSAETWLAVLTSRGFTGDEVLILRRAVSHLVIGAAARYKRDMAWRAEGSPRPARARKAVLDRPAEEVPLLRNHIDQFAQEVTDRNWEIELQLLLRGVVSGRNEATINFIKTDT